MSFVTMILTILGKKINLSNRLIIKESLNQNNFGGIVKLVINISKYTIVIELIGAIFLCFSFIPEYGIFKGIYYSIFHSISAFCNAGFDVLGNNSLINFAQDKIVNITIMLLIIIGGLGFTVWNDIVDSFSKAIKNKKLSFKKIWKELSLHTKLVLSITLILLVTGTIFICALEWNNKHTIYHESIVDKILISSFQSTTLRTARILNIKI